MTDASLGGTPAAAFSRASNRLGMAMLYATAVLGPLLYGSARSIPASICGVVIAAALACAAVAGVSGARRSRLLTHVLGITTTIIVVAVLQAFFVRPIPDAAIWSAAENGARAFQTMFSQWQPLHAVTMTIAPFLAFAAALALVRDSATFLSLWRFIVYSQAVLAVLLIAQFVVSPDWLLIDERQYYLGDFTGPFVSRNTAATYYGTLLILTAALISSSITDIQRYSLGVDARAEKAGRVAQRRLLIEITIALVFVLALFMTRSRAGTILSLAAIAATAAGLFQIRGRRRYLLMSLPVLIALLLFGLLGSRVYQRLDGFDLGGRACIYSATLAIIRDNPMGVGLGNFQDVYPAYRDPSCSVATVTERAHNTFLEGLAELGPVIVPLVAWVYWLLGRTYVAGLLNRRRFRFAPIACLGLLGLVTAHSLIDFPLQVFGFAIFLAVILGSGAAVSLRDTRPDGSIVPSLATDALETPKGYK
jgi:hypothetical protein